LSIGNDLSGTAESGDILTIVGQIVPATGDGRQQFNVSKGNVVRSRSVQNIRTLSDASCNDALVKKNRGKDRDTSAPPSERTHVLDLR
jgi:hypothetical protein